jgi:hypothetical protein
LHSRCTRHLGTHSCPTHHHHHLGYHHPHHRHHLCHHRPHHHHHHLTTTLRPGPPPPPPRPHAPPPPPPTHSLTRTLNMATQTSPDEVAFRWNGLSEWMARGLTFWWFDANWGVSIPPPNVDPAKQPPTSLWDGMSNIVWGSHVCEDPPLFVMPALTLENDGGCTPFCKQRRFCEHCSVLRFICALNRTQCE